MFQEKKDTMVKIIQTLTKQRVINSEERKLVEALRSGKYKQAYSQLFDGTGYCCLGVACKISEIDKFVYTLGTPSYLSERYVLPPKVRQKLGWATLSGSLRKSVEIMGGSGQVFTANELTRLNDFGVSFEDIATIIELGYVKTAIELGYVLRND